MPKDLIAIAKAKKLAMKDAQKEDIQTTAEGKAFLRARFEFHFKELKRGSSNG